MIKDTFFNSYKNIIKHL